MTVHNAACVGWCWPTLDARRRTSRGVARGGLPQRLMDFQRVHCCSLSKKPCHGQKKGKSSFSRSFRTSQPWDRPTRTHTWTPSPRSASISEISSPFLVNRNGHQNLESLTNNATETPNRTPKCDPPASLPAQNHCDEMEEERLCDLGKKGESPGAAHSDDEGELPKATVSDRHEFQDEKSLSSS